MIIERLTPSESKFALMQEQFLRAMNNYCTRSCSVIQCIKHAVHQSRPHSLESFTPFRSFTAELLLHHSSNNKDARLEWLRLWVTSAQTKLLKRKAAASPAPPLKYLPPTIAPAIPVISCHYRAPAGSKFMASENDNSSTGSSVRLLGL